MGSNSRLWRLTILIAAVSSLGARYQTPNFIVDAPTPQIAQQVAETAERCRKELALQWLGRVLPRWYAPCHVTVHVGRMGAGGATTFSFERGSTGQMEVFGWRMTVQGPLDRILDSVLPHEITHTILACHFRRPLPRWADEGAASLAEHVSERQKLINRALHDLRTVRRIPLRSLLARTEYPADMSQVLTLYAEGYLLTDFLVRQGGRRQYLRFLEDALRIGWTPAIRKHYKYESVTALEQKWQQWVLAGGPLAAGQLVATTERADTTDAADEPAGWKAVIRSQSPDADLRPIGQPTPAGAVLALADRRTGHSPAVSGRQAGSSVSATLPAEGRLAERDKGPSRSVLASKGRAALPATDGWTPFAGHTRPRYGEGLHAPDPRSVPLGRPKISQSQVTASPSAGPQRTGWVPHSPSRPSATLGTRTLLSP